MTNLTTKFLLCVRRGGRGAKKIYWNLSIAFSIAFSKVALNHQFHSRYNFMGKRPKMYEFERQVTGTNIDIVN